MSDFGVLRFATGIIAASLVLLAISPPLRKMRQGRAIGIGIPVRIGILPLVLTLTAASTVFHSFSDLSPAPGWLGPALQFSIPCLISSILWEAHLPARI